MDRSTFDELNGGVFVGSLATNDKGDHRKRSKMSLECKVNEKGC